MKKRLFATLLALVMALGLTVTAAADETDLNDWLDTADTTEVEVTYWYDGISNAPMTVAVTGYVLNGGSYKLTDNLTITAPLIMQGTVTLDLNGHTLKYENSTAQNSVIVVDDGANFTLTDSATGGKITGGTGTKYTDAEKNIYDTVYTDAEKNIYDTVYGGGVFVGSTATFNMTGGSIVDCSATGATNPGNNMGGGVYLAGGYNKGGTITHTTFNMTGGSIVGCHSGGNGGGVCARMYTNTTISNSEISNCTAGGSGGGVYCYGSSSSLSMERSTISGCTATTYGGGVNAGCTRPGGTFTMENSSITNCTAQAGGGVYNDDGTFTMKNGSTISGCKAEFNPATIGAVFHGGGGVYIKEEVFTMEAGSTISGCTSSDGKSNCLSLGGSCDMDAQGGSVRGSVYNGRGDIKNTSTDGSTLFYGGITNGDNGKIIGKRVTFKNGDTLYAETVANENGGKISQPVAPTAPEGKAFAGWSYTKNDGSTGMWNFGSTFATNDPECQKGSYISDKDITWDVATLTAVWGCAHNGGAWQHDGSGHWKVCTACGEKYDEAAHDGSTCAVCGYQKPTTKPTTPTETVTSPNTTDPGVLLSAALSVVSLLGMGYVGKKR